MCEVLHIYVCDDEIRVGGRPIPGGSLVSQSSLTVETQVPLMTQCQKVRWEVMEEDS